MPDRFLTASPRRSIPGYFVLHRGEDMTLHFRMAPPMDITGWTISLKTVPALGGAVQFTKSAAIVDGPRGKFRFTIANADTSSLTVGRYSYDVRRTDSGNKTTLADGVLDLRQEVTA